MSHSNDSENELDLATARRLRRLGETPVDLGALESRLGIPCPNEVVRRRIFSRPLLAMAASIAIVAALATTFALTSSRPVLASTDMLRDLYTHNDTMLMDDGPGAEPMACCVRQVEGRNVTCVSILVSGQRVMMTVGDGKHFKVPESAGRKVVGGVEYRSQTSGTIHMVMAVKDGAWICLMGEPSVDELIAKLASMPARRS